MPVGSALRRSRGSPRGWLDTARCSLAGPRTRSRGSPGTRPASAWRSRRGVPAGRKDRLGSNPASLAGGRISTGTAPTPSAYDVIASSRLRKSSRRMANSRAVYAGTSISRRRILIRGRNADAAFLRCLPDQSAERGKLFHPIDQGLPPARHLVVEVVMEVAQSTKTRLEFVVPAIDDQQIGTTFQAGQAMVLLLQGRSGRGVDLESNAAIREDVAELPLDDVADREPVLVGNPFGARFSHHDHVEVAIAWRVGKLGGELHLPGGQGDPCRRVRVDEVTEAADRHDAVLVRSPPPEQAGRFGQHQGEEDGDAEHEPAGDRQPSVPFPTTANERDAGHECTRDGDREGGDVGELGRDQEDESDLPVDPPGDIAPDPEEGHDAGKDDRGQDQRQPDPTQELSSEVLSDRVGHPHLDPGTAPWEN